MRIKPKLFHRKDAESAKFFVGAEQRRRALPGIGTLAPPYDHRGATVLDVKSLA